MYCTVYMHFSGFFSFALSAEAGISNNYCATNSGSPEVEPRFCTWAHIVQILNWAA